MYTPYNEGSMFRPESQLEMVVEQNLVFQLQWLIAGNLGPMPERLYPCPDLIERHWNLSSNLLEAFLEIECPKSDDYKDFKYSKRLTMLDYNAVHERLADILCPYINTSGDAFEVRIYVDAGDSKEHLFRSIDYYKRNRRVWYGGAEGPVWEDSMGQLFKNFDALASDIIDANVRNVGSVLASFNLDPLTSSEIEHLERVYSKVAKSNQVCYTLSERGNDD